MNKKLLIGIGIAVGLIVLTALLGKYVGYDIGYERAVKNLSNENAQDWKTYKNDQYGALFEYPKDWILSEENVQYEDGIEILSVISPEHSKQLDENSKREIFEGGYYYKDFAVSWCKSINTDCARGGNWDGMRTYEDIEDLLTDSNSFKQRSNIMADVNIGGLKGYGVISGGLGANYEVMVEYNGIWLLGFPNVDVDQKLSSEQQHILSSFKFTK